MIYFCFEVPKLQKLVRIKYMKLDFYDINKIYDIIIIIKYYNSYHKGKAQVVVLVIFLNIYGRDKAAATCELNDETIYGNVIISVSLSFQKILYLKLEVLRK